MKDQLNFRVFTANRRIWEENGKMVPFQISPKIESLYGLGIDRPQGLYGILQLLLGSHLDNFLLKTLKLGWVAFNSITFPLEC